MFVTMKEMLADAQKNHYALPAFDVSNYEMMRAVLDECEAQRSPALLMGIPADLVGNGMPMLTAMAKAASECYSIPFCFHLDHANDMALVRRAVETGFSSVMIDGSSLPFEENAVLTAEVVRYAHAKGVTVEAELGHVGNALVGNEKDTVLDEDPEQTLTDPDEVVRFIERTDVDALAVAIGTAHGVYAKTPTLRIDRLDQITAVCDRPLVLHGGSGTPEDQLQTAIAHGVTKINIYSDVVAAMNASLKNKINNLGNPATWPIFLFEEAQKNMRELIAARIRMCGSNDRA